MQVLTGEDLKSMLEVAVTSLHQNRERIDALNVFPVPDGDTGTNMALTLASAVKELEGVQPMTVTSIAKATARGSLMGARGNSGVILSQFFRGFSDGLVGIKEATSADLARALTLASQTTYRAVMKPVEGTILTVGKAAAKAAGEAAKEDYDPMQLWERALAAARKALADTPNILPVLKQAGVVDAGGEGLCILLEGAWAALKGETVELPAEILPAEPTPSVGIGRIQGPLANKYCTEFLIKGSDLSVDRVRDTIAPRGDSVLVVGDSEVIKIHIHTDHPGEVIEFCAQQGDLVDIKIDNMKLQNEAIGKEHPSDDNVVGFPASSSTQPPKPLGVVAVVPGPGLADIYRSLGVDKIVSGGQTMNPSTEELARAVEEVNADAVIILPNNKNVIFSAQQVKELVDKHIGVVATRSVPQGISALMRLDVDRPLAENLSEMEVGRKQVKTGEITFAVRSTRAGDLNIEKQDIIGLAEGKIAVAGHSVEQVAMDLLTQMVDENSSFISLYSGSDNDPQQADAFGERVRETFSDCDVEVYPGDQPLYYYILSVE